MKILFDHQIFTIQSYGGISRYYARIGANLINMGIDVMFSVGLHRNNYLSSLPAEIVSGINIKKYPSKTGRLFQYANYILTKPQIKKFNPDIIHETYYSLINQRDQKAATMITVYDMIHELHANMFKKNDATTKWKKKAVEQADHIISISRHTKNDLVNIFGVDSEKISVIHLGFENFDDSGSGYDDKMLDQNQPFLLYVGERRGYKNFTGLLKAVAISQKIKNQFHIIAFGGGKFTKEEQSIIAELDFRYQQVRQVSGNDNALAGLYRKATAFIYPSLYEGFGMPPLEAMACHCPVISSNSSSMPEVIGDAGEFFNPNSIEDIAAAIERVVFSEDRTKELKRKGQDRLKYFSWEKCARETLEVYKKVIG